jgi:hypothetical protein
MLSMLVMALALSQSADAPAAPQAPAAPTRSAIRSDEVWNLEYEAGPMRLFRDAATGEAYWYATFTLFNRSGQDRHVAPRWELVDEEGRVTPEGRGVPGDVTKAIQRLLNDPELQESHGVMGAMGQGPANAKSGFVVFPAGPELRRFSLLVSGLSNGEDAIKDVKTGKRVVTRRTWRIDYQVPGDRAALRGPVPLAEAESGTSNPSWIYR